MKRTPNAVSRYRAQIWIRQNAPAWVVEAAAPKSPVDLLINARAGIRYDTEKSNACALFSMVQKNIRSGAAQYTLHKYALDMLRSREPSATKARKRIARNICRRHYDERRD
jgi:hypothetical protein